MLVSVLIEIKALNEKKFTYSVPKHLEDKISLGVRVTVPFGKRCINGLVINFETYCEYETKDIIDILK